MSRDFFRWGNLRKAPSQGFSIPTWHYRHGPEPLDGILGAVRIASRFNAYKSRAIADSHLVIQKANCLWRVSWMVNYPAEQARAADATLRRGLMKWFPTPLRGSLPERLVGSLRYVICRGSSVKNGRKLVRRRRPWISLVIPLSPAHGKSSRPNEPNATYRRSKREKSTGVSIRNRQRSFILRKPASRVPRRRFEIDTFRNHDNGNKGVRTNALEFFGLTPLGARE